MEKMRFWEIALETRHNRKNTHKIKPSEPKVSLARAHPKRGCFSLSESCDVNVLSV